jgi:hypothetical protein
VIRGGHSLRWAAEPEKMMMIIIRIIIIIIIIIIDVLWLPVETNL